MQSPWVIASRRQDSREGHARDQAAAQAVKSQVRLSVTVTDTVRYFILKENWGKMMVNEMRVEKTRKAEFLAVGEAYKATF